MISRLLVQFYRLVHGKLHLRGGGWLIRRFAGWVPGLQSYPLTLPAVGIVLLDFRDGAAFGMLNLSLRDFGNERQLIPLMEKSLKPGDVLWDVGANVGIISAWFAHPRHQLRAICAFEPNPAPFKSLRSLFQAHPRVRVLEFGLGQVEGHFPMNAAPNSSEIGSLKVSAPGAASIQVQIRRGDAVKVELQLPAPDVIKMDVEGFELDVIGGLAETIAQNQPVIFFEHTWLAEDELKKFTLPGYELFWIHDSGLVTTDFLSRRNGHDAILVPVSKRDLVAKQAGG